MSKKYKTSIEITSEATDKDEAMEIVGEYLSGNIVSGIDMKCRTAPVRFYNNTTAKIIVVALLVTIGFLSGAKKSPHSNMGVGICQMDAVTPPLKTSDVNKNDANFKKEWIDKHNSEALSYIKK